MQQQQTEQVLYEVSQKARELCKTLKPMLPVLIETLDGEYYEVKQTKLSGVLLTLSAKGSRTVNLFEINAVLDNAHGILLDCGLHGGQCVSVKLLQYGSAERLVFSMRR